MSPEKKKSKINCRNYASSIGVSGWTLKCYKKYVFQALSFYLTLKKIITFSNWFAINQKKTFPHKDSDKTRISQACTHFMPISYSAKDIKYAKKTIANNLWHSLLLRFFPDNKN